MFYGFLVHNLSPPPNSDEVGWRAEQEKISHEELETGSSVESLTLHKADYLPWWPFHFLPLAVRRKTLRVKQVQKLLGFLFFFQCHLLWI